MQLIKINPIQTQSAQATFASGSQVLRLSILNPAVRTRPFKTALRGDYEICRIRMQSLGDDFLAHARTVRARGVDEIDPQFDRAPQHAPTFSSICRLAPNSISRDPHRAESQSRHTEIISDQELAGLRGESPCLVCRRFVFSHTIRIPHVGCKHQRIESPPELAASNSHR